MPRDGLANGNDNNGSLTQSRKDAKKRSKTAVNREALR
jgi:hypothetical protein